MQEEKRREAVAILEIGYRYFMLPVAGLVSDIAKLVAGAVKVDEKWIGTERVVVIEKESASGFEMLTFKVAKLRVLTEEEYLEESNAHALENERIRAEAVKAFGDDDEHDVEEAGDVRGGEGATS